MPQTHWSLAQDCIWLMNQDLKKNICNLSNLSKPNSDPDVQASVANHVPPGLIYCCQSWTIHLVAGQSLDLEERNPRVIINDLEHLSKINLLCWLEVMSLTKRIREAMAMAKQIEHHMMVSPPAVAGWQNAEVLENALAVCKQTRHAFTDSME